MAVDRLLPTDEGAELVSLVREIAHLGGSIKGLVPELGERRLKGKFLDPSKEHHHRRKAGRRA